jgi:hypothetical protein
LACALSVSSAVAEVYRDPTGGVAVGTNGSNADGQLLALSDSGSATAPNGVAASGLGSAEGYRLGVSATNWAYGGTASVSGTGTASGPSYYSGIAVSGTGSGGTGTERYAVSATGNANAEDWYDSYAVSGTGNARGTMVAVAPDGNADATGGYADSAAVSGTGTATGNKLAVSGTGDASTNRYCYPYLGQWHCTVPVAASGTGDAYGSGGVSVAGSDATSSGGLVCLSATGNCSGGARVGVAPMGRSN